MILLNAQSLPAHFDEVYNLVVHSDPLLVCLTEARLTEDIEDFEVEIGGYQIVRVDSKSRHTGGVIMYVRDSVEILKVYKYQNDMNYWFVVIKLLVLGKIYMVGNMYHSPSSSDSEFLEFFGQWCDSLEDMTDRGQPILIVGDFNINWLSKSTYPTKLRKLCMK